MNACRTYLPRSIVCAVFAAACGLSSLAVGQEITRKDFDDLKQEVADLKDELKALNDSLTALNLSAKLGALDAIARRVDTVEEKLGSVVGADGGIAMPSILGNMQKNPQFREEMSKVIQGKIVVNNTTGYDQFVHINGVRWRAPAGLSYTYVPYGSVQTQLNPFDPVREWTVNDWRLVDGGHQLDIGIQW
jgi:hypothetical protein